VRRVFTTTYDGVTVAADRADVLAGLRNAKPDDARLALRMLALVPYPLSWLTMWREVESVPGDCYVSLDRSRRPDIVRWWFPPEPELAAAEGAARLRDALADAVGTRVASVGSRGRISSDLSGGLDSTSLCFLAHRIAPDLVTFSSVSEDPANDDMEWAELAAAQLPGIDQIVAPPDPAGGPFAAAAATGEGLDEPPMLIGAQWNLRAMAAELSTRNVRVHLSGFGGDELLRSGSTHLHALWRSNPLLGLKHLRGLLAARRYRPSALIALAADRRTFGRWLSDQAARLSTAAFRQPVAGGWGAPLSLPDWVTGRAVELVREQALSAAQSTPPLAGTRAQHATIECLQLAGQEARLREHMLAAAGHHDLAIGLPYLDDQVIRAVLSVRLHERETPWTYKPLLTNAMNGILPTAFGARITKGDASVDVHRGYRRHRKGLFELCEGSLLHERGLIDLDRLRTSLSSPSATDRLAGLGRTFACEAWLRNHTSSPIGAR
jgi:asparagine synthase (glutamine-hydrolysing)